MTGELLNVAMYFYEPSVKNLQKTIWYLLIHLAFPNLFTGNYVLNLFKVLSCRKLIHFHLSSKTPGCLR